MKTKMEPFNTKMHGYQPSVSMTLEPCAVSFLKDRKGSKSTDRVYDKVVKGPDGATFGVTHRSLKYQD